MNKARESLGPKPTKMQMETLKKLALPGVEAHWLAGISSTSPNSAWIVFPSVDSDLSGKRESLRTDTLHKFISWGWLETIGDPGWAWRNNEYRITEKGRKIVEWGEIRK